MTKEPVATNNPGSSSRTLTPAELIEGAKALMDATDRLREVGRRAAERSDLSTGRAARPPDATS